MNNNFTRKFNIKGFSSRACLDLYIALSLMPNAVKRGMADKEGKREVYKGREEGNHYISHFLRTLIPPPKKSSFGPLKT